MSKVGYVRASILSQSHKVQLEKLTDYGCTKIFREKKSGKDSARPQLRACLDFVREGDTLVITKLDRLARSTLHLQQIADKLKNNGIGLVVTDQNIDTTTPTGKLLFDVLASIAEFETALRAERQAEGIAKAQHKGIRFGSTPKLSHKEVEQMKQDRKEGLLIRELMKKYKLSKSSVYRLMGGVDLDEETA